MSLEQKTPGSREDGEQGEGGGVAVAKVLSDPSPHAGAGVWIHSADGSCGRRYEIIVQYFLTHVSEPVY